MYFKTPDNHARSEIRIPMGYKGNAFSIQTPPTTPASQPSPPKPSGSRAPSSDNQKISETAFEKLKGLPSSAPEVPPSAEESAICVSNDKCDTCEKSVMPPKRSGLSGILSPEGSLDAEELLILALALIVFQGGKENELALLLLALLFIK